MAARQAIEGYVADLSKEHYTHFLRMVFRCTPEEAKSVATVLGVQLERLGVKPNLSKATSAPFGGALNMDVGSLRDWAARINKTAEGSRHAIRKLVALHATAVARSGG
jgi:hypothetical protein